MPQKEMWNEAVGPAEYELGDERKSSHFFTGNWFSAPLAEGKLSYYHGFCNPLPVCLSVCPSGTVFFHTFKSAFMIRFSCNLHSFFISLII